jgi:hypothetical protein
VLRLLGAVAVLFALVVPSFALGDASGNQPRVQPDFEVGDEDGGACSEDEADELIDCGAGLDRRFDEPLAITLLRSTVVRTTKQRCEELLLDIWSRETCSVQGRDCGKLLPRAPASPGPKLASSSTSASASMAGFELDGPSARRLGPPSDDRLPKLPDLQPPVPPPKLPLR